MHKKVQTHLAYEFLVGKERGAPWGRDIFLSQMEGVEGPDLSLTLWIYNGSQ